MRRQHVMEANAFRQKLVDKGMPSLSSTFNSTRRSTLDEVVKTRDHSLPEAFEFQK
jgi:hypothetical protein